MRRSSSGVISPASCPAAAPVSTNGKRGQVRAAGLNGGRRRAWAPGLNERTEEESEGAVEREGEGGRHEQGLGSEGLHRDTQATDGGVACCF